LHLAFLQIDYGPFGFLDKFDPEYTPNLTGMHSAALLD
jgi:uncharacterized protein YdiU (UPF0061 family)